MDIVKVGDGSLIDWLKVNELLCGDRKGGKRKLFFNFNFLGVILGGRKILHYANLFLLFQVISICPLVPLSASVKFYTCSCECSDRDCVSRSLSVVTVNTLGLHGAEDVLCGMGAFQSRVCVIYINWYRITKAVVNNYLPYFVFLWRRFIF